MLGIYLLILCFFVGNNIIKIMFPSLFAQTNISSFNGKEIKLGKWMILVPSSFLIGSLIITWVTYFSGYLFKSTSSPLLYGNILSLSFFTMISIIFIFKNKAHYINIYHCYKKDLFLKIKTFAKNNKLELLLLLGVTIISSYLMFYTFYVKDNILNIGYTVWSDFGPHLAVIRSFSIGSNFPTEYPHFPEGSIRYHFLFQFFVANLEFLGLRIDWAFNVPSIFSILALTMLMYSFSVIIFNKRPIGIIAVLLFFFRSSFATFTYIIDNITSENILKTILNTSSFIGKTQNENWGLWNQNVYANQRHFAFSLAILFLLLILLIPLLQKMLSSFKEINQNYLDNISKGKLKKYSNKIKKISWSTYFYQKYMIEFLFKKDSWLPLDLKQSIYLGLILGLIAFWNGAVVLSILPILFILAIFSKHRLTYLIIAVITYLLTYLQTSFFMGDSSSAVDPNFQIGFLAEHKNLLGIVKYYIELLGIFPLILFFSIFNVQKGIKIYSIAFLTPLIIATTLSLTPDINANHKFVMISVMLLNIIISNYLYLHFESKRTNFIVFATTIILLMTSTGVIDLITIKNANTKTVTATMNDPVVEWIIHNTPEHSIFLSHSAVTHPVFYAGRKQYYGWPYYAWSAGYDTNTRNLIVNSIYGATDTHTLKNIVKQENIDYIIIENENRDSKEYNLNEDLIINTYELVSPKEFSHIQIYKTN